MNKHIKQKEVSIPGWIQIQNMSTQAHDTDTQRDGNIATQKRREWAHFKVRYRFVVASCELCFTFEYVGCRDKLVTQCFELRSVRCQGIDSGQWPLVDGAWCCHRPKPYCLLRMRCCQWYKSMMSYDMRNCLYEWHLRCKPSNFTRLKSIKN